MGGGGKGKKKKKGRLKIEGAKFIRETTQVRAPVAEQRRRRKVLQSDKYKQQQVERRNSFQRKMSVRRTSMKITLMEAGATAEEADKRIESALEGGAGEMAHLEKTANDELMSKIEKEALTIFREWDKDGSGELDYDELAQALALAGFDTSAGHVDDIMNEFDTDGNGLIDRDEFIVMMQSLHDRGHTVNSGSMGFFQQLKTRLNGDANAIYGHEYLTDKEIDNYKLMFENLDQDGNMELEEHELIALLVDQGMFYNNRHEIMNTFRKMDANSDGVVDIAEFIDFMSRVKMMKEKGKPIGTRIMHFFFGTKILAPPKPGPVQGYLKAAIFEEGVSPVYNRLWVSVNESGIIRMHNERPESEVEKRNSLLGGNAKQNTMVLSQVTKTTDDELDLGFADSIKIAEDGNSSGIKFEVQELRPMRLWIFKAEDGKRAQMWVQVLTAWRDYISYQLMTDSDLAETLGDKAGKKKSSFFGSMFGWGGSQSGAEEAEGARSPSKRNSKAPSESFSRSRSQSVGSHTESEFTGSDATDRDGDFD